MAAAADTRFARTSCPPAHSLFGLAGEFEVSMFPIGGIEWQSEGIRTTCGRTDPVFRSERECCIPHRRWPAVYTTVWLKPDLGLVPHGACRRFPIGETHRAPLCPEEFSYELGKLAEGSSLLAGKDPLQGLYLLIRGSIVDHDPHFPIAFG